VSLNRRAQTAIAQFLQTDPDCSPGRARLDAEGITTALRTAGLEFTLRVAGEDRPQLATLSLAALTPADEPVTVQRLYHWLGDQLLAGVAPSTPVVLQKDAEGNGYSPLADASLDLYVAQTPWYGDRLEIDPEDPEDDDESDAVKALFLQPVN
jgi:hypothetical protein